MYLRKSSLHEDPNNYRLCNISVEKIVVYIGGASEIGGEAKRNNQQQAAAASN
jgi:hypothetical protein